ncbi:hypothetical protein V2J83_21090 [Pseudomonas alliivorans]|nr:hypothetical protein [Pseudomonas alliivorans]
MSEFSENWRHLKALLTGYASRDQYVWTPTYESQLHAKALSIFLIHAELVTPPLDRTSIESVLSGRLRWPNSGEGIFFGIDIPLSKFEEWGLISFYAGWCATHATPIRDKSAIDQSLVPVIEAIEHLKDIRWGRNGYIRPHYACDESELRHLLQAEFGERTVVEDVLPELELEGDNFRLKPGNQNFSSEISTQLWRDLRRSHSAAVSFERWMRYFCVNCEWAMPVVFDRHEYAERNEFNEQLIQFIELDESLSKDINVVARQAINEHNFSGLIRPCEMHIESVIGPEGLRASKTREVELHKPTISSLEEAYPKLTVDDTGPLGFVVNLERSRIRGSEFFYAWLLASVLNSSIRIEGIHLMPSHMLHKAIELAESRPILKYLLFVVLPSYELSNYLIALLAHKSAADVAFIHLAKRNFDRTRSADTEYVQGLEAGYQKLICSAYIQTVNTDENFASRLVEVLQELGEQCSLRSSDFFKGFEYRFLITLLESLDQDQVADLARHFSNVTISAAASPYEQGRQHFRYLLGFWLIERIETSGLDPLGSACDLVREALRNMYRKEFAANFEGVRSLEPSAFFATLPWKQLFAGTGQASMLQLSNDCSNWKQKLAYSASHPFKAASAVRHYLMVLMCVGQHTSDKELQSAIAYRVQEIIWLCAFGPSGENVQIFDSMLGSDKFELWPCFCKFSNLYSDELYSSFMSRCIPSIPLDLVFTLLEGTTAIARIRQLHAAIDCREPDHEDMSIHGVEQAFTSAFETGRTETAALMLATAKKILAEDRFANSTHANIVRIKKIWISYEYKAELLELYDGHKDDPTGYQRLAHDVPIPHEWRGFSPDSNERAHYNECEQFRRQVIATAYSDTDPVHTVNLMEALYKDSLRPHHGFVLLYGHLKLFATDKNKLKLKNALAYFLSGLKDTHPEKMDEHWVAVILEVYQHLGSSEIDSFWSKLSPDQQGRRLIFTPYCRALIARNDSYTAHKILARYRAINHLSLDDLEIEELISELAAVDKDTPSMKDYLLLMNEGSQRTVIQLQKHFHQISSKSFEEYVEVTKPEQAPHEYLRDAFMEIAGEIVLRKRNLQMAKVNAEGVTSYSALMLEDWINDWFVSLFDHHMSHAKVSLRDQKRGGVSASGKNPGEIDGYITSSTNRRIGIFEAFRLFSLDKTVIDLHLNKVAGYDGESLSPVVMVGYCDVKDFLSLAEGYRSYVGGLSYRRYTALTVGPDSIEVTNGGDHIWLGKEVRRRGGRDVVIYHILINLRFDPSEEPEVVSEAIAVSDPQSSD